MRKGRSRYLYSVSMCIDHDIVVKFENLVIIGSESIRLEAGEAINFSSLLKN